MKPQTEDHVSDYSKITDQMYIGSDWCQGVECRLHDIEFKKLKITVEINLENERSEQPTKGVEMYLWLPTVDDTCPSVDQLMVGTALIDQAAKSMKKIYVHCKNGHGRSPTLVIAYLTRFRQMTIDEAVEYVQKKRPEIHLSYAQLKGLVEFKHICR